MIKHLFFAKEGSEAGNYYNKYTLDYLEKTYTSIINLEPFDVLETVKERFKIFSKEILEKNEKDIIINNKNEIQETIVFDDSKKDVIKLIAPKKIKLKECFIEDQNLKSNGYEPSYSVYRKGNEIIITVEAPGESQIIKTEFIHSGDYIIIRIIGNKNKDNESVNEDSIIYSSRESGEFILYVPFKIEDFKLKEKATISDRGKGIFIIKLEVEN